VPLRSRRLQGYRDGAGKNANDANMNVTALVNASSGNVVERYAYDPYGRCTFLAADFSLQENGDTDGIASNYANDILYCGYRLDSETGLYHVRHRYLHPTFGRWLSRDTTHADGPGLYEYTRSYPTAARDPSGRWTDVERKGEARARVCCNSADDTWLPLAKEVGHDEDEHHLWAKDEQGNPSSDPPEPGRWYTLPNKVIIDYAMPRRKPQDLFGNAAIQRWERLTRSLGQSAQRKGFMVETHQWGLPGASDPIAQHMADEDLYAYAFVGHGQGGVLVYAYTPDGKTNATVPGTYVHHRIARMIPLACASLQPGRLTPYLFDEATTRGRGSFSLWETNVSKYGQIVGYFEPVMALAWQDVSKLKTLPGGLRLRNDVRDPAPQAKPE